jgi:hypothetical protein
MENCPNSEMTDYSVCGMSHSFKEQGLHPDQIQRVEALQLNDYIRRQVLRVGDLKVCRAT